MSELVRTSQKTKLTLPILPIIIGLVIPALIIGWTALHANAWAPGAVGFDMILIALLTQSGLTLIYLGIWIASALRNSSRDKAGSAAVLACIAFAIAAPVVILVAAAAL